MSTWSSNWSTENKNDLSLKRNTEKEILRKNKHWMLYPIMEPVDNVIFSELQDYDEKHGFLENIWKQDPRHLYVKKNSDDDSRLFDIQKFLTLLSSDAKSGQVFLTTKGNAVVVLCDEGIFYSPVQFVAKNFDDPLIKTLMKLESFVNWTYVYKYVQLLAKIDRIKLVNEAIEISAQVDDAIFGQWDVDHDRDPVFDLSGPWGPSTKMHYKQLNDSLDIVGIGNLSLILVQLT
jgi:hypothetical protein